MKLVLNVVQSLIRQYTWLGYYGRHPDRVEKPNDLDDTDVGLRIHVDHCIETLRLNLLCHADTTPFLYEMENEDDLGSSDFNAHHKCRNFEKVLEFWKAHTVIPRWPGGNRQYTVKDQRKTSLK